MRKTLFIRFERKKLASVSHLFASKRHRTQHHGLFLQLISLMIKPVAFSSVNTCIIRLNLT